jgi:hypothetical protein
MNNIHENKVNQFMLDLKEIYEYEVETSDGTIYKKTNKFNPSNVVRISYIPKLSLLPRHDIIFIGFKLKKRFSRAFMNYDSSVREYIHCIVADTFRMYLFSSSGKVLITDSNYELYL